MEKLLGVYKAIVQVSQALAQDGVTKSRSNTQQGYKFRGIDDVLNALSPMLTNAGLVILPRCTERNVVERQTKSGGALFYTTLKVDFDFIAASDGSIHTVTTYGEAMDSGDKSTNKAMSAAYKYAAIQAFCIPTEGDNDADSQTHEVVPAYVNATQLGELQRLASELNIEIPAFCTAVKVDSLAYIHVSDFDKAVALMERKRKPNKSPEASQ